MNKNTIIIGGIGLVVMDQATHALGITHTDASFWYIMVPIALAFGFFLRHTAGANRS